MDIPRTANETLFNIISKLFNLLNEDDINIIYQIKTRNNDTSRTIVEFNDKKKEILSAFKANVKSNPFTTKEIHTSFPDHKVYLNDQLSSSNRKILWMTKQIAANYNFKYVWANTLTKMILH